MHPRFKEFVHQINTQLSEDIISMYEFGSGRGELHPHVSDIDLFIVTKDKSYIHTITTRIRQIEKQTLHTSHSHITNVIEEEFFASTDYTGAHLICIGRDELDNQYHPKSFRLKFFTSFLVSTTILLYHLKHESRLLIGEDLLRDIQLNMLSFHDRVTAFLPLSILLLFMPVMGFNQKQFKVWCFKIIKYHSDLILTYLKVSRNNEELSLKDIPLDSNFSEKAQQYRYRPSEFTESNLKLYLLTWMFMLKNIPFLWKSQRFLRKDRK